MRLSKQSTYAAIMAGVFCAYALSYWIVREKSFSDADAESMGMQRDESDGYLIMLGLWRNDMTEILQGFGSNTLQEQEQRIRKIEKRVKFCQTFYTPLMWIDRTVTDVEFWDPSETE